MKKVILFLIAEILCINIVTSQNPQWINYTNSNIVKALAEKENYIWIGTPGGLLRLNKTTGIITFYNRANSGLPVNDIRSIAIDSNGNKWIGTYWGGLVEFDGTNWTVYNSDNSEVSDFVYSIAIDNTGNKWIGTNGGSLAKFDGTNWTVYNIENSGLPDNFIYVVVIDNNGNKWIGTWDGGLAEFNEYGINTSIDKHNCIAHTLSVYPNPASDRIYFSLSGTSNNTIVSIYNMQGKVVKRVKLNSQNVVTVQSLPSGVYFYKITKNNNLLQTGKFMKQ